MSATDRKRRTLLAGAGIAIAALLPAAPALAQDASPFRPERFDEDWGGLAADDAPYGAQFKNMTVVDGVTLSIGGDARWRFSSLDAPRLGLGGAEDDEWLLQRLLLHADLRFSDNARVFVQLGAHDGIGREIPAATDDNRADVQQAFFDIYTHAFGGQLTLRAGRQELSLGPRFATTRDSGNVRQRHDLVRLIYANGPWRADLFGGSPVVDERGAFDDDADVGQDFYGARVERTFGANVFDIYAYELDRDTATLGGVTQNDDRVSIGARLSGRKGAIDFDSEIIIQRGAFGDADIRAVGGAVDLGWRFPNAPLAPRVGGRFTYGSGDSDLSDDTQGTFAPPFPNSQWFGQNGLASFSNTIETAALIALNPAEHFTLNLKISSVWRSETADFAYAGNNALAGTSGGDDAFVGRAAAVSLAWRPNDNVLINPYVSYVDVGEDLTSRGAHDVLYTHLGVTLRF
ncbi:MAG: alginate export family protein [Alphaproteobacteria bacterium]|nr:alginate export family protein [Alphaproteobacteria bacterium]